MHASDERIGCMRAHGGRMDVCMHCPRLWWRDECTVSALGACAWGGEMHMRNMCASLCGARFLEVGRLAAPAPSLCLLGALSAHRYTNLLGRLHDLDAKVCAWLGSVRLGEHASVGVGVSADDAHRRRHAGDCAAQPISRDLKLVDGGLGGEHRERCGRADDVDTLYGHVHLEGA